jgi:hypothetical protein
MESDDGIPERNQQLAGCEIFDMLAAPLDLLEKLPGPVLCALLKASKKRTGVPGKEDEDNGAMSAEYVRLMKNGGEFIHLDSWLTSRYTQD